MRYAQSPGAEAGATSEVYPAVKSILFDGIDSYVVANDAGGEIAFNSRAHSISCWFKVPATSDPLQAIWSFARNATSHTMYMLGISSSGQLWIYGRANTSGVYPIGSGGSPVVVSSGLDDDAWHHVAITYDGSSSMNVYVDGGSANAITVASGEITADIFSIGARRTSSSTIYPLEGSVADFSIFDRVLDSDELAKLSTAPILNYQALKPKFWSWMGDKDALADMRDHGVENVSVALTNGVADDLRDGAPS